MKWEILKRGKELVPLHREQLILEEGSEQRDVDSAILLLPFPKEKQSPQPPTVLLKEVFL